MSSPVGYPVEGFDLANTAIQANPYPAYQWLRANAPVYRLRDVPMWVVSRHQEVEAVLRDSATFASDLGMSVPIMSIVMKDAPDHTRLRGTINRAFTPRAVQHLEPRITEVAHQLLDRAGGRMEFVHGYATPLSVTVICEMLGVPLAQCDALNRYARDALLASFAATGMGSAELLAEARVGLDRLMAILDAAIEQHLRAPADNIISTLVADEAKGVLTREELRNLCALLLIGGHETTANLMASGAWILAETPELWVRLRQEPALIARFVEELARMRPPLQRIARRTTRPVTLAGIELPANAMLMLFPGSANRDPARWDDPDRLDLAREGRGHLGFGVGVHTCPGGPLARMEARIAFETLLARSASLRLDPDARAVPVVGYAAGNLGWNVLPLIRTEAGVASPMQSSQDVLDQVCAIAAQSLGIDRAEIDAATCAKNTPEWDSLAHLVILDAIEKQLSIKLPRRAAYTAKDVGELAALVVKTRAGAP
jgi:cytochrome P450/acyl carrier protein